MVKVPPSISAGRKFLVARFFRELGQFGGQLDDVFLVDIAHHRHQQTTVGIDRNPDMDVLLVDDFLFRHVNAGVELGKDLESRSADFQGDGGHGHFSAGFGGSRSKARPQLLEFGDVGVILLGDVGNGVPGFAQMLGRFPAHPAHGDALDFSPFGEVGQGGLGKARRSGAPRARPSRS